MKFVALPLCGSFLVQQEPIGDERGLMARVYCQREFAAHGANPHFVQANSSLNHLRGTLRGLHYQLGRFAEAKLIRCVDGAICNVHIDLRPRSPTYLQHQMVELRAGQRNAVYLPAGCANGFQTLEPDSELFYLTSNFYEFPSERCVRWNDPQFGIAWPLAPTVISAKDREARDWDPAWHLDTSYGPLPE